MCSLLAVFPIAWHSYYVIYGTHIFSKCGINSTIKFLFIEAGRSDECQKSEIFSTMNTVPHIMARAQGLVTHIR